MKTRIFLLILIVIAQNLYSMAPQITGKRLDFYFSPEYNRAYNFCWDTSATGAIELNNRYTVKGGLALGTIANVFYMKGFAGGEVALPVSFPLYVSLAYNYNGLPEYENHTHSVLPLISLKGKWVGASLGVNLRSTSFFGEPPIFEPIISALIYVNFVNNNIFRIGLKIANIDDYTYGNIGSYFLNLNSSVRLNKMLSLVNEIELHQSGSIGLASNFYGFIYRGGVTLSW
jgi:hypothetical protein